MIELIVYIGVLAILILVSMSALISITKSYAAIESARSIHASVLSTYDRMANEIREASSINLSGSVLGVHPGTLSITDGTDTTIFSLENDRIKVNVNGTDEGYLTRDDSEVTNLVFERFDQGGSESVVVSISFSSTHGTSTQTADFRNTFKLRGSY